MAIVAMTLVTINEYSVRVDYHGYEYKENVGSGVTGDSILVPDNIRGIAVTLQIVSGTAKVQTTTSPLADVRAGTAVWVDWSSGAVGATTQDYVYPPTAIRQVNVSGESYIHLRAQ